MKHIPLIINLTVFASVFSAPVASLTWLAAKSATSRFQQLPKACEYIADKEKSDDIAAHLAQAAVITNEYLTCENKRALIKHIYLNRRRMWESNESIFRFLSYILKNYIIPANQKAGKELFKLTSCNAIVPNPITLKTSHVQGMPLLHYIILYHSSDILEWILNGKGMDVQVKNRIFNMNALHEAIYWAIYDDMLRKIELLLEADIDTTLRGGLDDEHVIPIELTQYQQNLYAHDKAQVLRFQIIKDMIHKHNLNK